MSKNVHYFTKNEEKWILAVSVGLMSGDSETLILLVWNQGAAR